MSSIDQALKIVSGATGVNDALRLVTQPQQTFGEIADLSNTNAPFFGKIRTAMQQLFGLPDYAKSNLNPQQRITDLIDRTSFGGEANFNPKAAVDAASKFGQTTQFGRRIGGTGGKHAIFIYDQAGNHVNTRYYNSATNVQRALDRIALPKGWQGWPIELEGAK